jgi:hypothetical protein
MMLNQIDIKYAIEYFSIIEAAQKRVGKYKLDLEAAEQLLDWIDRFDRDRYVTRNFKIFQRENRSGIEKLRAYVKYHTS